MTEGNGKIDIEKNSSVNVLIVDSNSDTSLCQHLWPMIVIHDVAIVLQDAFN